MCLEVDDLCLEVDDMHLSTQSVQSSGRKADGRINWLFGEMSPNSYTSGNLVSGLVRPPNALSLSVGF